MPFMSRQVQLCSTAETTLVENTSGQTMILFSGYITNIDNDLIDNVNLFLYNGEVRTTLLHNVPCPKQASLIIAKQVLMPGAILRGQLTNGIITCDCTFSLLTVRGELGPIGGMDPMITNPNLIAANKSTVR